jgi:hypothetical protein
MTDAIAAAADGPNPLLSLLRKCVVRIDCDGEFSGSGFFVAHGEILTCAHVIDGAGEITVTGSGWELPASVVAREPPESDDARNDVFHPLPDIALLRVDGLADPHPTVRLEVDVPAGGEEPDVLHLSAFSRDVYEAGGVERDGASLDFEESFGDLGLLKLKEGQVVRGFSGCPALNTRTGAVCGLIDSTRKETDDLGGFAVPMAVVASEFPGLLERNAASHVAGNEWDTAFSDEGAAAAARRGEVAKLPLVRPPYEPDPDADYAPSELLKPRLGVVGLIGRERLQAHLMRWREADESLRVLLISGGGGTGKTRLALEECARAARAGWTAGLLALDSEAIHNDEIERLVAWPGRLFVAIDYAETRPSFVGALIGRLVRREGGAPVRLVLVCRQTDTREQLEDHLAGGGDRDSILGVLKRAEPVTLTDREHQLDSQQLFRAGVAALAPFVGDGEPVEPPPVSLANEHFARPLFVLAAAQLCTKDPALDVDALGRDDLMLKLIDEHESSYWKRWDDSLDTGLDAELHPRAVAVAAMLGAESEDEALSLVEVVPGLEGESAERKRKVARWLSHLYGNGRLGEAPAVSAVEPDMLAEALLARECIRNERLIGSALDAATVPQLTRALNVLTRAASGNAELATLARNALGERLPSLAQLAAKGENEEFIAALDLAIVTLRPALNAIEAANELLSPGSLSATNLAVDISGIAIDELRRVETEDGAHRPLLAGLLNNLSNLLWRLGRGDDALDPVEEAVGHYRELAEEDPERFLGDLAMALNNFSNVLYELGSVKEALEAIEEAVGHYRELMERRPGEALGELATALNNLSNVLHEVGRTEEALGPIEEAVGHYRELAERAEGDRERYLADLAMALNNLSTVLDDIGRDDDALGPVEEAVGHYRALAERQPERYLPELAMALTNFSTMLAGIPRAEEALDPIEEAVRHYRALAERYPERYLADLAGSLSNLSNRLADLGRDAEGLAAVEEAVRYRRALAARSPGRYLPKLALSLTGLSNRLADLGRDAEGLAAAEEAVKHYRELAERWPERYQSDLALALNGLSNRLDELGRSGAGLEPIEEAVKHYRELAERWPERYQSDLAMALTNLSTRLGDVGRGEEALEAIEEAVRYRRPLVARNRDRYLPVLAGSLNNLSTRLGDVGRSDEGLEAIAEAAGHYGELAERWPERYLPELAMALTNYASALGELERSGDGQAPIEEAVGHYRLLAGQNPGRYLADLATATATLSQILNNLDRGDEARVTIEELLAEHRDHPRSGLLLLTMAKWHQLNEDLPAAIGAALEGLDGVEQANDHAPRATIRSYLRALRSRDEARFDAAWAEETATELPAWLQHLDIDRSLVELLGEWLQTPSWEDSQDFLEKHADALLSSGSEAALERIIDSRPGRVELTHHLAILLEARAGGVEATYAHLAESIAVEHRARALHEWLQAESRDELLRLLTGEEELLNPAAERDLLRLALRDPAHSAVYVRIALLTLARIDDPEAACALIGAEPEIETDEDCVSGDDGMRVLALARFYSGFNERDAQRQFHHAIAAAAAGEAEEAAQAIERCRRLLPTWEQPDYLRRLDLLAGAHPDAEDAIAALKDLLLAAPGAEKQDA